MKKIDITVNMENKLISSPKSLKELTKNQRFPRPSGFTEEESSIICNKGKNIARPKPSNIPTPILNTILIKTR